MAASLYNVDESLDEGDAVRLTPTCHSVEMLCRGV